MWCDCESACDEELGRRGVCRSLLGSNRLEGPASAPDRGDHGHVPSGRSPLLVLAVASIYMSPSLFSRLKARLCT